ncbi:MAG: hypothetical protein PHZ04_03240 [Patescibacteria group bacterium]|nr:hypothetical protein [Patescibacteria group bacterium]
MFVLKLAHKQTILFRKGITVKKTIIFTMVMALLFGLSSVAFAEGYAEFMATARNSIRAEMYGDALSSAQKALEAKQNGDAEAFLLVGRAYWGLRNYESACKNWENAFRFGIKNPEKYKVEIVNDILTTIRSASPNISEAKTFFNYAQKFGCPETTIAKEKMAYGKKKLLAVKNREEALVYVSFVGQDLIDKAFPPAQTVVVFEKSYDMKDAYDEYGQIRTFQAGKDDVRKGDKLEVIAKLKDGEEFSGQEIGIWRGKEFNPKWAETVNGYYNKKIEELTDGGFFVISLAKRDDVVVTVKISREIIPAPNRQLLVAFTEK